MAIAHRYTRPDQYYICSDEDYGYPPYNSTPDDLPPRPWKTSGRSTWTTKAGCWLKITANVRNRILQQWMCSPAPNTGCRKIRTLARRAACTHLAPCLKMP